MALLDYVELLALLRLDEKNGKEEKEEKLREEALRQASVLGDSALYRCQKKCTRIKQLTGGDNAQKWKE